MFTKIFTTSLLEFRYKAHLGRSWPPVYLRLQYNYGPPVSPLGISQDSNFLVRLFLVNLLILVRTNIEKYVRLGSLGIFRLRPDYQCNCLAILNEVGIIFSTLSRKE